MMKVLLTACVLAILEAASTQAFAQNKDLEEAKSVQVALRDVRKNLSVASSHTSDADSLRQSQINYLRQLVSSTSARVDHFQDVEMLRGLIANSRNRPLLEAAHEWINIRANMILPEIEKSIAQVNVAQKYALDRRTEAAAVELRKQIRRVLALWKSRKSSQLKP